MAESASDSPELRWRAAGRRTGSQLRRRLGAGRQQGDRPGRGQVRQSEGVKASGRPSSPEMHVPCRKRVQQEAEGRGAIPAVALGPVIRTQQLGAAHCSCLWESQGVSSYSCSQTEEVPVQASLCQLGPLTAARPSEFRVQASTPGLPPPAAYSLSDHSKCPRHCPWFPPLQSRARLFNSTE